MEWERKSAAEALVFVLLMAFAIGAGFFRRHVWRSPWLRLPRTNAVLSLPKSPAERTARLYEAARPPLATPESVGAPCRDLWHKLLALDLAEFVEYPPRPGLVPSADGCLPPGEDLDRAQSEFTLRCRRLLSWDDRRSQREWRHESRLCRGALVGYRAAITDWLTRGRRLASLSDPLVLTDKLIASLGEDRGDAVAVAERLLQIEPQMYPAAKAVLVTLLDDAATRADGRPDDPIWEKIDRALQRAEGMAQAERQQLLETELAVIWMRTHDPQAARQKAEALSVTHPELGAGPYYEAWAALAAGDRAKAKTLLQEAIRREPKQRHFRETWDKLDQRGESPFRTYLSFGFDK